MAHIEPENPCVPSPCGPNSQCRQVNGQAVCSCLPKYVGSPPGCRPECVTSAECPHNLACVNQKCVDPCNGVCGLNSKCTVINHSPICSCQPGNTGDPFTRCFPIPSKLIVKTLDDVYLADYLVIGKPKMKSTLKLNVIFPAFTQEPVKQEYVNPCVPSPCGLNSECRDINGIPSCSCKPTYIGSPPNCRPECLINSECSANLACIKEKCRDPCPGSCGVGAKCSVINHTPVCSCPQEYTGDPFSYCYPKPPESKIFYKIRNLFFFFLLRMKF